MWNKGKPANDVRIVFKNHWDVCHYIELEKNRHCKGRLLSKSQHVMKIQATGLWVSNACKIQFLRKEIYRVLSDGTTNGDCVSVFHFINSGCVRDAIHLSCIQNPSLTCKWESCFCLKYSIIVDSARSPYHLHCSDVCFADYCQNMI